MRTSSPTLSNLEEGTYTFELVVTDAKGQTAKDEVKVYVKAAINLPPEPNAGEDQEISLPQNLGIFGRIQVQGRHRHHFLFMGTDRAETECGQNRESG